MIMIRTIRIIIIRSIRTNIKEPIDVKPLSLIIYKQYICKQLH